MSRLSVQQAKGYLEDYLRQRGINPRRRFRCLSPDHEDRNPSMSYNPGADNVHCFACGVTYDLFDLIGIDYGLERFPDQYARVCELFGIDEPILTYSLEKSQDKNQQDLGDKTRDINRLASRGDGNLDYFLGRGITEESCRKHQLFQLDDRAYFPVFEQGICTGWCARAIQEGVEPRYRNSKGSLGIWNGDLIRSDGGGRALYIAEGIMDALCLEQLDQNAMALCGSQNIAKLVRRCQQNPRTAGTWRYVLCGDGDEAGRKMNEDLSRELTRLGLNVQILNLPPDSGDVAALYCTSSQTLASLLDIGTYEETYDSTSAAAALDDFFAEAERRSRQSSPSTGIGGLDRLLDGGLHPGLYVLGAISSLGKTSLALQIADVLAEQERDVLFITLEQSRSELLAKSLCRTSALLAGDDQSKALTVRMLLSGRMPQSAGRQGLLQQTKDTYARNAKRLFIREGFAAVSAMDIREMVRGHREARGCSPIVVVDYLQILTPMEPRASDKQNTDRAVVELKRISRDFDIPVIAISSFNRENYRTIVSMESFKESGAVEYSADVLLGLQLAGTGQKEFDINRAKLQDPRQLELVMLKNRSGLPYGKVKLQYRAKFGLFEEA